MGLAVQNVVSAATGLVVAMALMRGFARHGQPTLGNLWVDLTRCILWILLPLLVALLLGTLTLVGQPMNTASPRPRQALALLDPALLREALVGASRKLEQRVQWRNPVMFVVNVGGCAAPCWPRPSPAPSPWRWR